MRSTILRGGIVGSLLFALPYLCFAQFGPGNVGPPPVGRALGLTPEIRTIFQDMIKVYQEAESYQDQGRVSLTRKTGRVQQITLMPTSVALRRPNFLQLVGGGQLISCNGKTLQIALDGLGQYTATKAPDRLRMRDFEIGAPGGGLDEGYPEIAEFLCGDNLYDRWIKRIDRIAMAEQRNIEGRLCHVVQYRTVYMADVLMFIDAQRHVLLRSVMYVSQSQPGSHAPPGEAQDPIRIEYDLIPVRVNDQIPDSEFELAELKGIAKVDQFSYGGQPPQAQPQLQRSRASQDQAEQLSQRFLGKPVPEIAGTDLNGEQVSLRDDTQDGVTLLFLWTPRESDSLRAIQMVQRINDQFTKADKFSVLSVCTGDDDPDLVRNLLVAKKSTYRTMIDTDHTVMSSFSVEELPLFLVVASDRKVSQTWYGAPAERELQIVAAIKKQLAMTRE